MIHDNPAGSGSMILTVRRVLITAVISTIAYPLSYAPLDRLIAGPDNGSWPKFALLSQPWRRVYEPLSLVIDRPLAQRPFGAWSRLWGVGMRHTMESVVRAEGGGAFASDAQRHDFYKTLVRLGVCNSDDQEGPSLLPD